MCKSLSCDVIIGNFIIEAVKRDYKEISINHLISFDKKINSPLNKMNYTTKFSISSIVEFKDSYPFFISSKKDNTKLLEIIDFNIEKEQIIRRLTRYFRMGLPKKVIDEFASASITILG